jgi:hypothetical protein
LLLQPRQLGHDVLDDALVVLGQRHLEQLRLVSDVAAQLVVARDPLLDLGALTHQVARLVGVVPEALALRAVVQPVELAA